MDSKQFHNIITKELDDYIKEAIHVFGEDIFKNYTKDIALRDFALHLCFAVESPVTKTVK